MGSSPTFFPFMGPRSHRFNTGRTWLVLSLGILCAVNFLNMCRLEKITFKANSHFCFCRGCQFAFFSLHFKKKNAPTAGQNSTNRCFLKIICLLAVDDEMYSIRDFSRPKKTLLEYNLKMEKRPPTSGLVWLPAPVSACLL